MSLPQQSLPADQSQRDQALEPQQSCIVQAPAGSGKTGLLVQRYLALLATVNDPEEILAITFTRKATGEMRERVLAALAAATAAMDSSSHFQQQTRELALSVLQRDAECGWHLREHPNRLRIVTIDALNASLTRQLPLLSGFGAPPQIADRATDLYRQAARRTLRGDGVDDALYAPVLALLAHLDGDHQGLEELLGDMLAKRQQWQNLLHLDDADRATLEAALQHEIEQQVQQLSDALQPSANGLMHLARFAADRLPGDSSSHLTEWRAVDQWPAAGVAQLTLWQGLLDLLLTSAARPAWRKRWTVNEGFPAGNEESKAAKAQVAEIVQQLAVQPRLLEAMQRVRQLPAAHYSDGQWTVLSELLQVLRLALANLQVLFAEQGTVDHSEVALRALQALGDADAPTDLALKLDYRISHLLVDEFQDTSRAQVELLQRLTAGWQAGDGRTLFLVGDPMQSIYRFRQAEVGLFLNARHHGLGGVDLTALQLRTNFRARKTLVDWVNQHFAGLFPGADDLAANRIAYAASVANDDSDDGAVQLHCDFATADDGARAARQIAQLAATALSAESQSSAAILVRRRQDLIAIIPALREAGLAFEAVEIETLAEQPVVQDLYALTRALLHPADDVAWLACLRAPWCGLDLYDLDALMALPGNTLWQRLRSLDSASPPDQLSTAGRRRLQRCWPLLREAARQRRRQNLRQLVAAVWRALGGPACLQQERERADVEAYLQLLELHDQAGDSADPIALEETLQTLYAQPDSRAAASRLKLMTIHKAKGLEFDHVFLPGLASGRRPVESGLLLVQERVRDAGAELLLGPLQAKGDPPDRIQSYVRLVEQEQLEQEQLRLLYVAVTRARRQLHLFAALPADPDSGYRDPQRGSLLALLWPQIQAEVAQQWQAQQQDQHAVSAEADAHSQGQLFADPPQRLYQRLPLDWQAAAVTPAVEWRQAPLPTDADSIPFDWAGMRARHLGTVVHAWLERIAEQGLDSWDETVLQQQRDAILRRYTLLGIPAEQRDELADQTLAALRQVLADDTGRWILGPHPQAQCEYALNAWLDDRLHTLIIDRTFVDQEGTRWIIDYKTSSHQGSDLEDFLDHERERYSPQLRSYARVMALMEQRPTRLALYFPLFRRLVEIEPV
ncbi:MAG: UvrD-helicase domain-containing protein [Wenzhouxiangellaceae bacterium]